MSSPLKNGNVVVDYRVHSPLVRVSTPFSELPAGRVVMSSQMVGLGEVKLTFRLYYNKHFIICVFAVFTYCTEC